MSLINTLETKFGRYAVPHLVRILAGFQVAVWLMIIVDASLHLICNYCALRWL